MPGRAPTAVDLADFARHLMASGWTRLPADYADFVACRIWPDDSADTVAVFDLARSHAMRETADGTVTWLFDGDLLAVRRALADLGPPPGRRPS